MSSLPKHFNFLRKYGDRLETDIGYPGLSRQIPLLRTRALSGETFELGPIAFTCRKIVERLFEALLPDARADATLHDLINEATSLDLIPPEIALKCRDLRRLGNAGVHASIAIAEARHALALLDQVLRWYVVGHYQDNQEDPFPPEYADDVFSFDLLADSQDLVSKAQIAASLNDDPSLADRARAAYGNASKASREFNLGIEDISRQIPEDSRDGSLPDDAPNAEAKAVLEHCDAELVKLTRYIEDALADLEATSKEIDGILSEHDFIERLLHGRGQSTVAQWRVMRFPREANSSTNILQIAGGAGTGKTLCLIAKTLRELDDGGQPQSFESPRRALFVCFNQSLASHVKELVSAFPEIPSPTVITLDTLVNQLVRPDPDDRDLAQHAASSRYGVGWKLHYASDEWSPKFSQSAPHPLTGAIGSVAKRHSERAGAYYLDSSTVHNLSWIADELDWLEARYDTAIDAQRLYPTAPRTGRGASGRMPNASARAIILEIWEEYAQKLLGHKLYTIEQATKRLLGEDDLPRYDVIAIDEVQDLSINEIRFLFKLRRSDASKVFLAGDENQKIFQRDFTWKELDTGAHGYTIKLDENKRNSPSIQRFSERLLDVPCSFEEASRDVRVLGQSRDETIALIRQLVGHEQERTAIIGDFGDWKAALEDAGIPHRSPRRGISEAGLYLVGERGGKGLEFDNVVVDCEEPFYADDAEAEKRLRYMHFTRAIKQLFVCYDGTPPKLIEDYYPDFVEHAGPADAQPSDSAADEPGHCAPSV